MLVQKAAHVLVERLALLLLDHRQIHLQLVPLVDRVLVE
jgi:hypothetical protein